MDVSAKSFYDRQMYSYCIHGLNLRSEIPLKESQDSFLSFDISIQRMKQLPKFDPPLETHILKSSDHQERALISKYQDGSLSIDYYGCGFFYFKNKILSIKGTHRDKKFFEAILTTQILPLLSSLFRLTLHGGVVIKNHKAAIYLGQEGVGKSTLTTYLLQKNFNIWSDDVAAIDSHLCVLPGLPEIRINEDSSQLLLSSAQIRTLKQKLAKHQILIPQPSLKNAELAAIFLLKPSIRKVSKKQTPITSTQRLSALIENQFRWDLWNSKTLQTEFNTLTALCAKIPLVQLEYPFCYDSLAWVEQQIERSLNELPQNLHSF